MIPFTTNLDANDSIWISLLFRSRPEEWPSKNKNKNKKLQITALSARNSTLGFNPKTLVSKNVSHPVSTYSK
jgi:hypothetical protein